MKGFKSHCVNCNSRDLKYYSIKLNEKTVYKVKKCDYCNREVTIREIITLRGITERAPPVEWT